MVIFVFLRSFWATVIPGVTVPLALLGACALMWAFGYTLDNLSLMALTIAVGFVVDDAIVMLENITRYVEQGEKPLAAAFRGASEIGFTIVSISISLVAVLIPLLLMGGVIGRLFREFAVTLAMAIFVSLVVSLTLTPMMASRFLRAHGETRHGRFYQWSERAFERMLHAYERGLDLALRRSLTTLCIFFATVALSVYLFIIIPKGFFPQQDNGFLTAVSEASQDISFADMKRHQEELSRIVQADPAVDSIAMFIGGGGTALNSGRMYVTLKPREERDVNAGQIIARLRPKLEKVEGARLYMQASQDVRLGGRATRTQFEFTLQDANLDELDEWAPKILARMQKLPELRDVATDQQTEGTTLATDHRPRHRLALRHPAATDRRYAVRRVRPAPGHAIFHPAQLLSHRPGNPARAAGRRRYALQALYQVADDRRPGAAVRVLQVDDGAGAPALDRASGPVSGGDHQLQSRPGRGARTSDRRRAEGDGQHGRAAPRSARAFRAPRRRFSSRSARVPLLILAALVVVYLILGILYESYIHPLTILSTLPSAGVGALAILMAFGFDFSLIALIGIILLIGIVKKNGIMMVDFAIAAEREQHLSPRGIDPQGRDLAISPDHDDDDGGAARRRAADARHRDRRGNPPAARLCDGRRPHRQPGADTVHDAGDLSLSRQSLERDDALDGGQGYGFRACRRGDQARRGIAKRPPAVASALRIRDFNVKQLTLSSSPGLTGRSSMPRPVDFTSPSLEYWIARIRVR